MTTMEQSGKKKIEYPNTTQIPHVIIREWMPRLKDVELRMLLVVADQTLGWIEDQATGRRKEKDWISHGQLVDKMGRSDRSVTSAAKKLIDELRLVAAYDEAGNELDSPEKRRKNGSKIYYRLTLHPPQPTLFDKVKRHPRKICGGGIPPQNLRTQNLRTTKLTKLTKESLQSPSAPVDKEFKSRGGGFQQIGEFLKNGR